ncbi:hypothetical protein [Cohnella boryungensis]
MDVSGSYTLEASMVMPWVLMLTFLLLFFALYISQSSLLYYSTSMMTERAAFGWSNSAKNVNTGEYPPGQYEGLYWRLTDDYLVGGLFGLATGTEELHVEVYPGMPSGEGNSAQAKLSRYAYETAAAHRLGEGLLSYRNIGVKRTVEAKLASLWAAEPLARFRGGEQASSEISALVVEPAEFLRTFDLIRYYAAKMREAPEGKENYRSRAGEVIASVNCRLTPSGWEGCGEDKEDRS